MAGSGIQFSFTGSISTGMLFMLSIARCMGGRTTPNVSSMRLDSQNVVREVANRSFDFSLVHGKRAIRMGHKRALIGEIVELHRHALAVRLHQSKPQRAERRRQKRSV